MQYLTNFVNNVWPTLKEPRRTYESKEGNLLDKTELNKYAGQLAAQMLDSLTWLDSVNRGKDHFVKGILSIGQTCLFFGAANKDTNGNPVDKPEMYFYGCARLNVLRSGIEGDQLIFDPVVVSDYLRKLYLFLKC
jgi:hypothetical protein